MIQKNNPVGRCLLLVLTFLFSSLTLFAGVSDKDLVVQGFGQPLNLLQKSDLGKFSDKTLHVVKVFLDPNIKQIREKSFSDTQSWPECLWGKEDKGFTVSNREIKSAFGFLRDAAETALKSWGTPEARKILEQMAEVLSSLQMNFRNPNKASYSLLPEFVLRMLSEISSKVGTVNDGEAKNLNFPIRNPDISSYDPVDSTLWSPPKNLEKQDLTWGSERKGPLISGADLCKYDGAKSSYGTHPGFKMKCGDKKQTLRVKFAEIRSQSFSTRVLSALGYSIDEVVDPLNYILKPTDTLGSLSTKRVLRLEYNHEILSELHKRKQVEFDVTLFPGLLTLVTENLTELHNIDPFLRVQRGYLSKRVEGAEQDGGGNWYLNGVEKDPMKLDLKKFLLRNPNSPSALLAGRDKSNYNLDNEKLVTELVMAPVQVKTKEDGIGPWDWNEFGHDGWREARGLGLIAAWMGWHDVRFDNNRLGIIEDSNGQYALKHYLHDTGSVLGESANVLKQSADDAERFPWSVTLGEPQADDLYDTHYFKVVRFNTLDKCDAFEKMNVNDAKWGARLIARLSPQQLDQALIGSGFSAAEVVLLREKLLLRRFMALRDLGLGDEYAGIAKGPAVLQVSKSNDGRRRGKVREAYEHGGAVVDMKVNFDPTKEALPVATKLVPEVDNYKVVNGNLRDIYPNVVRAKVLHGDIVELHPVNGSGDYRKRHE